MKTAFICVYHHITENCLPDPVAKSQLPALRDCHTLLRALYCPIKSLLISHILRRKNNPFQIKPAQSNNQL